MGSADPDERQYSLRILPVAGVPRGGSTGEYNLEIEERQACKNLFDDAKPDAVHVAHAGR